MVPQQPQQGSVAVKQTAKDKMQVFKGKLYGPDMMEMWQKSFGDFAQSQMAALMTEVSRNPKLLDCDAVKVILVGKSISDLGLPVSSSLGYAYIVPYGTEPTMIVSYRGYIQLALRTGQYRDINADVVYEGETVTTDRLTGRITITGEPISSNVIGYFAFFELKEGFAKCLYMTKRQMVHYAKRFAKTLSKYSIETIDGMASKPYEPENQQGLGWTGDYHSMGIKTVLRRLLNKWGLLSTEMQKALDEDERNDNEQQSVGRTVDFAPAEVIETAPAQQQQSAQPAPQQPQGGAVQAQMQMQQQQPQARTSQQFFK